MAATKLFILGSTGYIGGDAIHAIASAHPEYEITALVRNSDKGAKVAQHFPSVKLVYGDLDSSELLEKEAAQADIVCSFANADHADSIEAVIRGLATHKGFLIHTSGTGILLLDDMLAGEFGTKFGEKVYDDLEGVGDVTSLPDQAPHRNVDKIVLAAAAEGVRTAIVCPPTIYGVGNGPDNQRSMQLPDLVKATLQTGNGFRVNEGKTYWGNVHVHDLSALYLKLVEEAAAGGKTRDWNGKPAVWGEEGYFFCENGEHVWGEVSQWVADEAQKQGFIASNEVKSVSADEAAKLRPFGHALWGANSRARAKRAREVLGWNPTNPSLKDEVKMAVEIEAKSLGLKPGHAAVAAGDR